MSVMTAAEMISVVRDISGAWDEGEVFDGYPADDDTTRSGPRILRALNRKLKELQRLTGFNRCYFEVGLVDGVQEYILPRQITRIILAEIRDESTDRIYPIAACDIKSLNSEYYGSWRTQTTYRPFRYYTLGSRAFGVHPIPNTTAVVASNTGCTMVFLAEHEMQDMTVAGDIPTAIYDSDGNLVNSQIDGEPETSLPESFHMIPCYGAAVEIAKFMKRDDLVDELSEMWRDGVTQVREVVEGRESRDIRTMEVRSGRRGKWDYKRIGSWR